MDAAIRKKLENNTLPFGEMPRELQEALVIAICVDKNIWCDAKNLGSYDPVYTTPAFLPDVIFRIAPEPVIMPTYPWDLFDDEIQWMAIDESGELAMAENKMEQSVGNGNAYWFLASCRVRNIKFNRGNVAWQDSQMERPKK